MVETAVTVKREEMTLRINEIFYSIQGEGTYALYPCVFIRLTGCNLRCSWCDTTYSFHEGEHRTLKNIQNEIATYPTRWVEITGGEPLLQRNVYELFDLLHELEKCVLLETSGSILLDKVPSFVHIVLDMKAPGSGESEKNRYENLKLLKPTDDLKIVVKNKEDFNFAVSLIEEHSLMDSLDKPAIVQPVFGALEPHELGEWVKFAKVPLRLGMQLHKYIYDPKQRAV